MERGNKFLANIFLYDDRDYFKLMTVRSNWVPLLQKESIAGNINIACPKTNTERQRHARAPCTHSAFVCSISLRPTFQKTSKAHSVFSGHDRMNKNCYVCMGEKRLERKKALKKKKSQMQLCTDLSKNTKADSGSGLNSIFVLFKVFPRVIMEKYKEKLYLEPDMLGGNECFL